MRRPAVLIFLLIVLTIYSLINFYILRRGRQALSGYPWWRIVFTLAWGFLILAYPVGRAMNETSRSFFSEVLIRTGSFYMALMVHLLLLLVVVDLLRLADTYIGFFPRSLSAHPHTTGLVAFSSVLSIAALAVIGGYINALHPRLRTLDIAIERPAGGGLKTLNIIMASDIHLGTVMDSGRLKTIIEKINGLNPDIVLLPGDIVDESVSRAEEEKMISRLRAIEARFGVFSVPGNHESYGGLAKNLDYLKRGGVRVLQDEAVVVNGAFSVAGRKDPTALRHGEPRKPIHEILEESGIDRSLPLILLDHQPIRLEDAEKAGIDLQFSGHTHAGQIVPLNFINKRLYEQNWGYCRKGNTQYYISCGVGTWGPPIRTGNIPEIVRINLTFQEIGRERTK